MKKLLLPLLVLALTLAPARADEGMWMLPYLGQNAPAMKKAGVKLTPEQIYSINKSALKDAIVIFGGGCTGEIVSPDGLLFTNHHCGFGAIQELSSMEHNYLQNGFWAQNRQQELPAEGLKVQFVKQIKDVTTAVLEGVKTDDSQHVRDSIVNANIKAITKKSSDVNACLKSIVVPMFGGNQYLEYVYEVYGDVRLVGTPPQSIGKFGGDVDNWMWPRHTGDFSIFRVYASPDNKPTKGYAAANVPLKAKNHLAVSTKGVKEGDYTMIMGFPGRTNRYMTTWQIDQTLNVSNPIRIFMRGEKQNIWWADMMADPAVRLKYSSKFASSSNYWKNSIGMSRGLKRLDIRGRKQAEQEAFTAWVNADPARKAKYGEALNLIRDAVLERTAPQRTQQLITEALGGAEAYKLAGYMSASIKNLPAKRDSIAKAVVEAFFKDYNAPTDKAATLRMFEILADSLEMADVPSFLNLSFARKFGDIFENSIYTNREKLLEALADTVILKNDPIYVQAKQLRDISVRAGKTATTSDEKFAEGHRLYLAGLTEMYAGKKTLYPDANFTIRLTYGNVKPYKPADAAFYDYKTTLEGVIAKWDPADPEFELDPALYELWKTKNYGRWAVGGTVPTCFLSTNDITGGNSGSPVLNAKGELIGLAFDGNWEAMSGDIAFEPKLQRCINLDVRYLLFIVEKLGKAGYLLDELTLR